MKNKNISKTENSQPLIVPFIVAGKYFALEENRLNKDDSERECLTRRFCIERTFKEELSHKIHCAVTILLQELKEIIKIDLDYESLREYILDDINHKYFHIYDIFSYSNVFENKYTMHINRKYSGEIGLSMSLSAYNVIHNYIARVIGIDNFAVEILTDMAPFMDYNANISSIIMGAIYNVNNVYIPAGLNLEIEE